MKTGSFPISAPVRHGAVVAALILLAVVVSAVWSIAVSAQIQVRNVNQARDRIRDRMIQEQAGNQPRVTFNEDSSYESVSSNETRMRGTGAYYRNRNDGGRNFSYDAVFEIRSGALRSLNYNFTGSGGGGGGGGNSPNLARDAVINQIKSEYGPLARVTINTANPYSINNAQEGVHGKGVMTHNIIRRRQFDYDVTVNIREGRVERGRIDYDDGSSSYIGGSGGNPGPANCSNMGRRPGGSVLYSGPIINRGSNKALDVAERNCGDRANIQQWDFADQPNQNWDVVDVGRGEAAIVSQFSGRVLDVAGDSKENGANVQQVEWNGGKNQRWRLERTNRNVFRIVNANSNRCLDVYNYSRDNGANIWQWECHGQPNQQWRVGR